MSLSLLLGLACSPAPPDFGEEGGDSGPSAPVFDEAPTGWAAVPDLGLDGTTGGLGGEVVTVATTAEFVAYAETPGPRTILVSGVLGDGGRVTIASNQTVIGLAGAEFHGGLRVDGGSNVIIRNLKIVGNNCDDSPGDCSGGSDALSIGDGAHHVWVDHCDVSNGSDGNLDVNDGADYVTISWTKFSYTDERVGGHQFSNLIGSGDNSPEDIGHLRVTWHHNWWADNVRERMPRVRYGQVHIFNNLYTSRGNNYCIGLGFFANVLSEGNVFIGVNNPIEANDYSNAESVLASKDDVFLSTSGDPGGKGTGVFTPPYEYTLQPALDAQRPIENTVGPCRPGNVFVAEPLSCSLPQ